MLYVVYIADKVITRKATSHGVKKQPDLQDEVNKDHPSIAPYLHVSHNWVQLVGTPFIPSFGQLANLVMEY
jgi:hypothetical protein